MKITLYRGVRNKSEKDLIEKNFTAGGKAENPSPSAPTNAEMADYEKIKGTEGECAPPPQDKVILTEFTEYTTAWNVAESFGHRSGFVVQIEIDDTLVRPFPNDSLEHGVLIRSDTPIDNLQIISVSRLV